jgi:hypothetical protein
MNTVETALEDQEFLSLESVSTLGLVGANEEKKH